MHVYENTVTIFQILTWLPDVHLVMNPFGNMTISSVSTETYIGTDKVIYSLSFR